MVMLAGNVAKGDTNPLERLQQSVIAGIAYSYGVGIAVKGYSAGLQHDEGWESEPTLYIPILSGSANNVCEFIRRLRAEYAPHYIEFDSELHNTDDEGRVWRVDGRPGFARTLRGMVKITECKDPRWLRQGVRR